MMSLLKTFLPIKYYMCYFSEKNKSSEKNKDELGISSSLNYTSAQIDIIVYKTNVRVYLWLHSLLTYVNIQIVYKTL